MMNPTEFRAVSRERPCVICGKGDWCRVSGDGCCECHRITDALSGFKLLKVTQSGYGLYRSTDDNGNRSYISNGNGQKPPTVYSSRKSAIGAILSWPGFEGAKHTDTWTYYKSDGSESFSMLRFDKPDGSKVFRPLTPVESGWIAKRPTGWLPLYNLQEVKNVDRVFVCEGEKVCEAGRSIGLVCTTSAGGSNGSRNTDWAPLKGKRVCVLPDNDSAGRKYADAVAEILQGIGCNVGIVRLPNLPEGGDLADYIDQRDSTKSEDLKRFIESLADQASIYQQPKKLTTAVPDDDSNKRQTGRKPPTTEIDLARRFVDEHVDTLCYALQFGWLYWNGSHWARDEMGIPERLCQNMIKNLYRDLPNVEAEQRTAVAKNILAFERHHTVRTTLALAESNEQVRIASDELDRNLWLFNHETGTVDLNIFEFREHRRSDMITKIAAVEYDPDAQCPQWERFLTEIFAGDAELIAFVQRALGYSLTGDTSEQCLFLPYGSGANGKSTMLRVVQEILGDYAVQIDAETLMTQPPGKIRSDLARLRGVRFVTSVETQDGRRLAESLVKQLTGGDKMVARFLYKNEFEFFPQCKIWIAANHKPRITGQDHAIWRRIHLIPFNVKIPPEKQDKRLADKLIAEGSGILNWLITGCLAWQSRGLQPPETVKTATEKYRVESDILGHFFDEHCIIESNARVAASDLYAAYKAWAESSGEYVISSTRLGLAIQDRGFTKLRVGPKKRTHYLGIRLRNNAE